MRGKDSKANDAIQAPIFRIHSRFLRSTHLERDWNDPAALDNYVFTLQAAQSLTRFSLGLNTSSSLRAWRITGDYGSGKSSYALLLANILSKRWKNLQQGVKDAILTAAPNLAKSSAPKLIPILVTGSRESLSGAILSALLRTLKEYEFPKSFYSKLEQAIEDGGNDDVVLEWLDKTTHYISKENLAGGFALILDEAGKFLEYAAMRPDQQDVYLLQRLAEAAARSARKPFYVLTIFHQGITSYAEGLSKTQQREWEKVAGRFEELIWHHPVDQTVKLIVHSLNTDITLLPKSTVTTLRKDMQEAIDLMWFGSGVNTKELLHDVVGLFPIHPTVVPVLVKLFSIFGQNERSLYSFLLSAESFGLQDHTLKTNGKEVFRLYNLYDYARNTFGTRLASLSYHWKAIDTTIRSFKSDDAVAINVLKTAGIINLINSDDLLVSREILNLALSEDINKTLSYLEKKHHIHYRGRAGGYCVWPNTSVNLDEAYESAKKAVGTTKQFTQLLRSRLDTRPIVARRHYIETGTLRYFEVRYINADNFEEQITTSNADGQIVVPLCETPTDVRKASTFARTMTDEKYNNILFVVPGPLSHLSTVIDEARRWEWIERSIGELRHDKFAREEVSRQLSICHQELQNQIQSAIGLTAISHDSDLQWHHQGKMIRGLDSGKKVMNLLSELCDSTFASSPIIHNELVNRREPSSAATSARQRLCERLFELSNEPYLGMDAEKHPPEMSMYLSVLQEAGLHKKDEQTGLWGVALPNRNYDSSHCRILPAMNRIHDILRGKTNRRLSVTSLFTALRQPPYGVTDGMIPLLLAVFAVIHEHELAFYEDGSFVTRISGSNFLRLIKAPETFEVQYYPISGIRSTLFHRLVQELGLKNSKKEKIDILDVVKPLMLFMSGLPEYVLNTTSLSPQTQTVRNALRTTTDPVDLLFHELPEACGIKAIDEKTGGKSNDVTNFVDALKYSVDELRSAYPVLLKSIEHRLFTEFQLDGSLQNQREAVAERAEAIAGFVTEITLKSFCLRLADQKLADDLWLESIGNLLCAMPPAKWRDRDNHKFDQEIHRLTSQFLRVEATLFKQLKNGDKGLSVRLALTRANGEEKDQVIHLTTEQAKKMTKVEEELKRLLLNQGQIGIAAASEVLWQMMAGEKSK